MAGSEFSRAEGKCPACWPPAIWRNQTQSPTLGRTKKSSGASPDWRGHESHEDSSALSTWPSPAPWRKLGELAFPLRVVMESKAIAKIKALLDENKPAS